jgi:hypothetical protein
VSDGKEIHRDASKFKLANALIQEDDENGPSAKEANFKKRKEMKKIRKIKK